MIKTLLTIVAAATCLLLVSCGGSGGSSSGTPKPERTQSATPEKPPGMDLNDAAKESPGTGAPRGGTGTGG